MADYVVTSTSVLSTDLNAVVDTTKNAGVAITAGQAVYYDTATGTYKLAQATLNTAANRVTGIALNTAAIGQPVVVLTKGILTLNAVLTSRSMVVLSGAAAGGVAPHADLVTNIATWYPCFIGIPLSTSTLYVLPYGTGI